MSLRPIPRLTSPAIARWLLCIATAASSLVDLPAAAQTATAVGAAPLQVLPDFTELVERVGPAVVNIRTTVHARGGASPSAHGGGKAPPIDGDLLDLLRRFGIPIPDQSPNQPSPHGGPLPAPGDRDDDDDGDDNPAGRAVGSGFILNADGYVMTNAHVVDGADEVLVTLTDKREFKAKILGADKRTDVALLKIEATGLPWVRLGDVAHLKVGEWVIAIGSPFNLDNTVTAGIVSAKARDTGDFLPFIQTDVAINPGNSGGPLINMRGEVVGINSQIYSRSGGFMGISFAIPIDEASRVADQLRASGHVVRGRIGVQIDQVGKDVAEAIGLGRPTGALVRSVEAGGPADKGGVEAGDIITQFNGRTIDKAGDLPRAASVAVPGSTATVRVFRRGSSHDLTVGVVEFDTDRTADAKPDAPPKPAAPRGAFGLGVVDLTDAERRELKLKAVGVRVATADGPAAHAGIREGDVILALGNTEVTSASQFQAVAAKADRSKPLTALVRRGDGADYVVIRPAK